MKRANSKDLREFEKNKPASRIVRIIKIIGKCLLFLLFFLGLLSILGAKWYTKYYSDVSIGQLLYHLYAPFEGADTGFIETFLPECLPIPVIGTIIFGVVYILNKKILRGTVNVLTSILLIVASIGTFLFGASCLSTSMHLSSYIENLTSSSDIYEKEYVDPKEVEFTFPTEKRNLIYIFCESMETTYEGSKDGGITDTDYIPELTKLQNENDTFNGGDSAYNGYYVPTSSNWTVAGIVGQTCGTPLTVDSSLGNNITEGEFLPNATSIGDILEQAGYTNEFMCGSDIAFGGRENYLTQHGNYKFFDINYARSNDYVDSDYGVWWGFEDAKLFEFAKSELNTLSSKEEPFNLTLLTVDTHFPNGYTCQDCDDKYDENYSNVMTCSSKKISEFVEWAKTQDWYENTTIVIAGDHKTMDTNWFKNKDTDDYTRKAYYTIINSAVDAKREDSRTVCTYDLFPTTLASLGVTFNSERLGFGTNLYGESATVCEKLGFEVFNDKISIRSDYYINYLFGGRDVTKSLVTEDSSDEEVTETEPALPEYFEGTYDYSTGTTTTYNGQTYGGGSQQYIPVQPSNGEYSGSENSGEAGGGTSTDTGGETGGSGGDTGGTGTDTGGGTGTDTGGETGGNSGGTDTGGDAVTPAPAEPVIVTPEVAVSSEVTTE